MSLEYTNIIYENFAPHIKILSYYSNTNAKVSFEDWHISDVITLSLHEEYDRSLGEVTAIFFIF